MEELISKIEWHLGKEKSLRNRILLQDAIDNLKQYSDLTRKL